jgi:hypothetical protein
MVIWFIDGKRKIRVSLIFAFDKYEFGTGKCKGLLKNV